MSSALRILVLIVSCASVSCTFHSADLKYPSVAEADAMDVQWGLPKRKARGGPKQFFQSNTAAAAAAGYTREEMTAPSAGAATGRASAPTATTPAPAPAAAQPSVNVPANLR